jgi:hypothetical protein
MKFSKLAIICGLLAAPVFAGVVESQKDGVDVYSAADKASSVIVKLKKGDTLRSQERSGMYWQVKTSDGKSGFVSVLVVKVKPEEKAGLNDAMREAVKSGRSQSTADGGRTRSAVMGVRGLDDTTDTGLAASLRPNLHAVYAMEDYDIQRGRIDAQANAVTKEIEGRMSRGK